MTIDEAKEAISEMKAQGSSEEEIAASFYLMFVDDKIDVKQFDALVNLLGYHLSDDFLAMGTEQQKTQGFGQSDEKQENVSDEEVELAKNDETNPFKNKQESEDKESEKSEDSEDSEEDKAMKLFGK
jgi:hypothetical protein